jgi:hypothetical protein
MSKMFWILNFEIHLAFACLRESLPCGAKAGILAFDLLASNPNILILGLED